MVSVEGAASAVIDMQAPKSALVGDLFDFTVQLNSPMLISLTRCCWMIEALGMLHAIKIPQPYVHTPSHSVYSLYEEVIKVNTGDSL